jgi:hypothetical protein
MTPSLRKTVTDEKHPRDAEFNEASSKLRQGLKTCQAMVANYRAMLAEESHGQPSGRRTVHDPNSIVASNTQDPSPDSGGLIKRFRVTFEE